MTVDVTPRRAQKFRVEPGQKVEVSIDGARAQKVEADKRGLVTVRRARIESDKGTRVVMRRQDG